VDAVVFRTKEFSKRMNLRDDVDVSVICETAYTKSIVTRQYNIAKIPLQVMIVGRLIPHKAPDFAVRAFSRFISNGGEGELHIYGDGPLRSRLEKQAMSVLNPGVQRRRGKIIFHGNVPNAEVLKALDSADVMLHLSFREGGSWSMLEAMAHGLPVVCQRASGMDDMVTDNCGFKIAASNPDSLTEEAAGRLMEYYSRRDLLRAHGVEAQKRVSSIYRWENVANQIDEVYSRITGGGNAK
jgi:glycosyltransferase involved in cell wall biosynthesis